MCLTFFVIVLNIMAVAFGGPGLDIKPWYRKNGQKSSKKAQKTTTWYSFRKPLTFFIIVLNIVIIAFGGPGLHIKPWYYQWDYFFELFFLQNWVHYSFNYFTIVIHQFFTSFILKRVILSFFQLSFDELSFDFLE